MAGRPSERQERRKQRTRSQILSAALEAFSERGYQAATVSDIAERADVALRSVYLHFEDKRGLYAALIDHALELDREYCDAGWDAADDPIGRIQGIAEGYLRFYREQPGYFRIFRFPPSDVYGDPHLDKPTQHVADRIASEIDRMSTAVTEAIDLGLFRPGSPRAIATYMWASWDGVIACHMMPGHMGLSDDEFEDVLNEARAIIAFGLLRADVS
ncbi:TetR/AcrR family transcriptional regulator [Rhodococcus triatomae]|uniref:DNA-binding transcriptional regulator, AcrR family n=1 Tax=Rhodococcus triatomae TaxID=300028 RepID=A0A1G8NGA9_9NOCA|nr:TetR/AcrR family transcriptional regulator [Rhodococcus triatomae]QNG20001.1 TetR/AcrR family transcriptional regulator [Rhodococcus triatomae]QNG24084.1 TetR/AcrR family transcriptional regulator [Rhodococcus triatomae]SDI79223.1 DNA-binding transcriptional regulator, AcrR family [Rhodococcus triatomae]